MWGRSLLLLLSLLSVASSTHAQSPRETALARSLFQEGVALGDRGDWVGAADRFERAYSLRPTSGLAFNWASALLETGKLLQARELLIQVERDTSADPQLRSESETKLRAVEARIAHLRVLTEDDPEPDVTIAVDGESWPRAAWGIASPINPGLHTIVRSEDGVELMHAEVALGDGESRDVELSPAREAASDSNQAAAHSDSSAKKPLRKSWVLWTSVGAVVLGGVIAGVLIAKSGGSEEAAPVPGNTSPGVIRW